MFSSDFGRFMLQNYNSEHPKLSQWTINMQSMDYSGKFSKSGLRKLGFL